MSSRPPLVPVSEIPDIPVLDQPALDQIKDLDDGEIGLTIEMFEMFEADQPNRISALQDALESNDLARAKEIAHTIKGASGTIGAKRLRVFAALMEAYGNGLEVGAPPAELLEGLKTAYQEAHAALDCYIKGH